MGLRLGGRCNQVKEIMGVFLREQHKKKSEEAMKRTKKGSDKHKRRDLRMLTLGFFLKMVHQITL